jgi:hypothetical protein
MRFRHSMCRIAGWGAPRPASSEQVVARGLEQDRSTPHGSRRKYNDTYLHGSLLRRNKQDVDKRCRVVKGDVVYSIEDRRV